MADSDANPYQPERNLGDSPIMEESWVEAEGEDRYRELSITF